MPITPIDIFSQQQTGLEQLLSRGTGALSQALDRAVQIGRDQANNQGRQETDLIAEQRREVNLRQRRGENLLAQQNTNREFGEGQRRFDTQLNESARKFDQTFAQSERQFTASQALAATGQELDKRRVDISEQNAETSRMTAKAALAREERDKELFGPKKATALTELRTAKLKLDSSATQAERDKIALDLEKKAATLRPALLQDFTEAKAKGDKAKMQETAIALGDPSLGMERDQWTTIAREAGLDTDRPYSSGYTRSATGLDMSPERAQLTLNSLHSEMRKMGLDPSNAEDVESYLMEAQESTKREWRQAEAVLSQKDPNGLNNPPDSNPIFDFGPTR